MCLQPFMDANEAIIHNTVIANNTYIHCLSTQNSPPPLRLLPVSP